MSSMHAGSVMNHRNPFHIMYELFIADRWISYEVIELTVCITNTFSNNFSNKDR